MIKKVIAENFLSWERLEFDFNSGVTLIEGFNLDDGSSEGSGKSAIPNALCWGLYGCIPKDVNIDEVVREGQDSCTVTVYTNDDIQIVRKRGPNELFIIDSNGQRIKGKDVKETQKKIQELLGMSFDTFCQSVYFAQNYARKFITASEEDKARIFSELQDLSWCDKSAKNAADALKELKLSIDKSQNKVHKLEGQLYVYNDNLKDYKRLDAQFELDKEKELQNLHIRIKADQSAIAKYEEALNFVMGTEDFSAAQKEAVKLLQSELAENQKKLDHWSLLKFQHERMAKTKNCPTCGQCLPEQADVPPLPPEPEGVKENIAELKKNILDALKKVEVENDKVLQRRELNFKINMLGASVKTQQETLVKVESKVNLYGTQVEQVSVNIKLIQDEILEIQTKMNLDYEKITRLETLKAGFKELKSHVFQSLIADLNAKANKYVQELFDVPASVQFSNISENGEISKITTTVTIDGNERSIGLLSGGQFRRVQIAVDFALSEIVAERGNRSMNLRILDEPFKDLSEIKMEKIVSLLEHMAGTTVIIEHNSLIKTIVNQVFKVELKNGVSIKV